MITALRANGYPKRFVIHASKPKQPSQQMPATAQDDKKGLCILPYVKGTMEPIKRILSNYNIKSCLKTTPYHQQFISQTKRPSLKRSDLWCNLFNSQSSLWQKLHRGNGTKIFHPAQRTSKSGCKQTLAQVSFSGTLFTVWPHHLLGIFKEPMCKYKLAQQTHGKLTLVGIHWTVMMACISYKKFYI